MKAVAIGTVGTVALGCGVRLVAEELVAVTEKAQKQKEQ